MEALGVLAALGLAELDVSENPVAEAMDRVQVRALNLNKKQTPNKKQPPNKKQRSPNPKQETRNTNPPA